MYSVNPGGEFDNSVLCLNLFNNISKDIFYLIIVSTTKNVFKMSILHISKYFFKFPKNLFNYVFIFFSFEINNSLLLFIINSLILFFDLI